MATSFDALKKSRAKNTERLTEELSKMNKGFTNPDEGKYWKPKRDDAGNGYAVIRFLSAPVNEDNDFVQLWDHGFQGPGGWYIENSLTTLGKADPVSEHNSKLWNSGIEDNKKIVRDRKRRLHYIANVYIVKDQGQPENEGKVFLWKFGKKIFDKLKDIMNPQFEDEAPVNPFDMWEGANFKLKIRKVEGYVNYDKSEFDRPSALANTDEEIEAIWKQCHSLAEVVAPKNFKTYEELQKRFLKAIGEATEERGSATATEDDLDMSRFGKEEAPRTQREAAPKSAGREAPASTPASGDDDDDLEFFKNLAKG